MVFYCERAAELCNDIGNQDEVYFVRVSAELRISFFTGCRSLWLMSANGTPAMPVPTATTCWMCDGFVLNQ